MQNRPAPPVRSFALYDYLYLGEAAKSLYENPEQMANVFETINLFAAEHAEIYVPAKMQLEHLKWRRIGLLHIDDYLLQPKVYDSELSSIDHIFFITASYPDTFLLTYYYFFKKQLENQGYHIEPVIFYHANIDTLIAQLFTDHPCIELLQPPSSRSALQSFSFFKPADSSLPMDNGQHLSPPSFNYK